MKIIKGLAVFLVVGALFAGCFSTPEYSNSPTITFDPTKNLLYFVPSQIDSIKDSLVFDFGFKDGDGDLGLKADENDIPYHPRNFFLADGRGGYKTIGTYSDQITEGPTLIDILSPILYVPNGYKGKLVTVRTRKQPGYDSLPTYPSKYHCANYAYSFDSVFILERDTAIFDKSYYIKRVIKNTIPKVYVLQDTLYYQANPGHNNIFVSFQVLQPDGTFEAYNWLHEQCASYDQRFPVLSDKSGPLEGTLRYGMVTKGFSKIFANQSIKLSWYITDRALHKSNVVETPVFQLTSIRRK